MGKTAIQTDIDGHSRYTDRLDGKIAIMDGLRLGRSSTMLRSLRQCQWGQSHGLRITLRIAQT